jgi:hypothetical protein
MPIVVLALALTLLATRTAYADDGDERHVAPCRPTLSCTADLVAPGTLEVEVGYQLRRGGDVTTQTTPVLVKLPLAHWLELQAGDNGFTTGGGARYVDNVTAGAKLHLLDQTGRRPSVAITATAALPTHGPFAASVVAAASKDLGAYHFDGNAGIAVGQSVVQPYVSLAVTRPLSDRWSATIEPHYFAYAEPLAPRDGGAIVAVAFAPKPWLVIDVAVDGVAIGPRAIAGLAGLSIAPVRLWGAP